MGHGWNAEEYTTRGVDLANARAIMNDKMALMAALWQDEVASYQGEYCRVEPSWSWPKPVQASRPPVPLGARASRANFADVAAFANG